MIEILSVHSYIGDQNQKDFVLLLEGFKLTQDEMRWRNSVNRAVNFQIDRSQVIS
jgi:hypothetical protein